jgi:hypothetical protein
LFAHWTRRLFALRLRCVQCGERFRHVHELGRTVVGYHGCSQSFAADLLAGRVSLEQWKTSQNDYDWLGAGIYFWEHAPGRAWQWAREHFGDAGAVVAAEIRLGRCLDLGDTRFTGLLRATFDDTVELYRRRGWELPKNAGKDLKLRRLDRLIIDQVADSFDKPDRIFFQTVRSPFEEGDPVYPGGLLRTQSHIQVAVRDRSCIGSRVVRVDPNRGFP